MTHEERMEKYGAWPNPPFTNKDEYLAWVGQWKARYKKLSAYIRQGRYQWRIDASLTSRAQDAAGLNWNQRQAGCATPAQEKAVAEFREQFKAELSAHKRQILDAEPVKIDGFREWCSANARWWTAEQVATGMLYDRHRAKAWAQENYLRSKEPVVMV